MTTYSTEFASLLASSGMDQVVFLTDIYDSPEEWSHRTKTSGSSKISMPYLNLLAATTPDWIARSLPLDTVGIGLTSRIIFVYSDKPRIRDPFPTLSKEQQELEELLIRDLQQISLISGQFELDPEAKDFFTDWYKRHHQVDRPQTDQRLLGYDERKPMHILKVAMLISASQKDEPLLTKDNVSSAMAALNHIEPAMRRTFEGVGKNPLTGDIFAIANMITARPGIAYGELLNLFKHSVREEELNEILVTLTHIGSIRTVQTPTGPRYYPASPTHPNPDKISEDNL